MTHIAQNVFVIDDDAAVRDALRMMLKIEGYAVATFASADEFLVICNPNTAGCIILDVDMPGMDGFQLQEKLTNQYGSRFPIIFLTGQGSIPLTVRAIKAGAKDFLTKPVDATLLLTRIQESLAQCSHLQERADYSQSMDSRIANLSEREREVMQLVIKGHTSKEIAEHLGLSSRTVENHRAHIMYKTGSSNLVELASIAMTSHVRG
jgi:FixJ family two-component response regulator